MPNEVSMVEVVVSIDKQDPQSISAVSQRLRAAGMQIDESMEAIGTVTGRIPSERLEELGHIEGVAHIERAGTFQIPPPDSDVL
jgi:hypothetical protein